MDDAGKPLLGHEKRAEEQKQETTTHVLRTAIGIAFLTITGLNSWKMSFEAENPAPIEWVSFCVNTTLQAVWFSAEVRPLLRYISCGYHEGLPAVFSKASGEVGAIFSYGYKHPRLFFSNFLYIIFSCYFAVLAALKILVNGLDASVVPPIPRIMWGLTCLLLARSTLALIHTLERALLCRRHPLAYLEQHYGNIRYRSADQILASCNAERFAQTNLKELCNHVKQASSTRFPSLFQILYSIAQVAVIFISALFASSQMGSVYSALSEGRTPRWTHEILHHWSADTTEWMASIAILTLFAVSVNLGTSALKATLVRIFNLFYPLFSGNLRLACSHLPILLLSALAGALSFSNITFEAENGLRLLPDKFNTAFAEGWLHVAKLNGSFSPPGIGVAALAIIMNTHRMIAFVESVIEWFNKSPSKKEQFRAAYLDFVSSALGEGNRDYLYSAGATPFSNAVCEKRDKAKSLYTEVSNDQMIHTADNPVFSEA